MGTLEKNQDPGVGQPHRTRQWPEWMIRRAQTLPDPDRALVLLYLERGGPYRQIAAAAGLNEATVARRIKRCMQRLSNGSYVACLRNRHRLTRTQLGIARDYYLESMSVARIAVKRGVTTYRVRQALERVTEVIQKEVRRQKKGQALSCRA
ncbi:MAG: sigma-70 family RNA polymerase sigma factor [Sedimentisphaerales bacterium]|nr:sigma-70 family RNA polymerase sigma factor [Sedimentisphaerales bacterium]